MDDPSEERDTSEQLPKSALESWNYAGPSEDFEARLFAKVERKGGLLGLRHRPTTGKRFLTYSAAALVLFTAGSLSRPIYSKLGTMLSPQASISGQLSNASRKTLSLGDRALVVAEAGSSMRWKEQGDGTLKVSQTKGKTFFRVDKGDQPFVVETPFGQVRVTGTCFGIELQGENKMNWKSILPPAAAVGMTVMVYEGSVLFSPKDKNGNFTSGVALAAGNGAQVGNDGVRTFQMESSDAGPEDSKKDYSKLSRAEAIQKIARLEAQNRSYENEMRRLARETKQANRDAQTAAQQASESKLSNDPIDVARRCAMTTAGPDSGDGCPNFLEPTQELLDRRAECGAVAWDTPPLLSSGTSLLEPGSAVSDQGSLSPKERELVKAAEAEFDANTRKELLSIYKASGGEVRLAETLDTRALFGVVQSKAESIAGAVDAGDSEDESMNHRLARELAKQHRIQKAGPNASPAERISRLAMDSGDYFEEVLGSHIGLERARELRTIENGWDGSHSMTVEGGCPDE